jgi:hypothetical protein
LWKKTQKLSQVARFHFSHIRRAALVAWGLCCQWRSSGGTTAPPFVPNNGESPITAQAEVESAPSPAQNRRALPKTRHSETGVNVAAAVTVGATATAAAAVTVDSVAAAAAAVIVMPVSPLQMLLTQVVIHSWSMYGGHEGTYGSSRFPSYEPRVFHDSLS